MKKPRIVVAGQVPPPFGGQNIMIQKAVAQFARSQACETVHLPFFFTPDVTTARKGGFNKAKELINVIGRFIRIRLAGPIDLLLYPVGGPQKVPMIRDLLLLPWMLMLSRRVVLHFHAAGFGDRLKNDAGVLVQSLARIYRKAFAAIVNANFNRRDPEAIGINRISVISCRIDDDFDADLVSRKSSGRIRILYVGHLCPDKGTPQLLQAFRTLPHPDLEVELVGECLPPFSPSELTSLLDKLEIRSRVHWPGLLTGRAKAEAFGRANLFVFPTIAPYESFGLVLAEAMAWGLPIVASRWRGNFDVLTSQAGAIGFDVSPALAHDIARGLEQALARREEWTEWGKINRAIFEERYRDDPSDEWLLKPILSFIQPNVETQLRTG